MAENKNWGGKRENAGRKRMNVKVVSFTMEEELLNSFSKEINRSKLLNGCVKVSGIPLTIIETNRANAEHIKKNNPNDNYQMNLDFDSVDEYDATKLDCWSFKTGNEVKDGIVLDLGNQCSGYPFVFHGHNFYTSESAYLCGQFSQNTDECYRIQQKLISEKNGYRAKRYIKNYNKAQIRADWDEVFMAEWMLYVIWCKCRGNKDFADKLKTLPRDAIIIENSTTVHEKTSIYWGSINDELEIVRDMAACCAEIQYQAKVWQEGTKARKRKLEEEKQAARNEIHHMGTFHSGHNYMGKILKRCQLALLDGIEPEINYDLLREKNIYLLGELLRF